MSEKLKALKAEQRIRQRQYNAAKRALERVNAEMEKLEAKHELARAKQKP